MNDNLDIVPLTKEILDSENLLEPRKKSAISFLDKKFSTYKDISDKCIDLLNKLSLENPQVIIDLVNESASSEIYTIIIANYDKKEVDDLYKKITHISVQWEISVLYKFAAFLLSGLKAPMASITDKKAIFSHFNDFGFTAKVIEEMRFIRNAKNHKFTVSGDSILIKDGDEDVLISFKRIDEIHKIVESFSSWWLTFITTQIFYSPSYGVLAIYSLLNKAKSNKEFIKEYSDGIKYLFPNITEAINPKKHLSPKQKVFSVYRKVKRKVLSPFRTADNYHYFLIENKEYYFNRLTHHSKVIVDFVKGICDKLINEVDKQNFDVLLKWFSNFNVKASSIDLDAFEKKYVEKFFR